MSQQQKPLKFYSFITCPYAIRVRMALEEFEIPYEYHEIDLLTDRHLTPEYLKINPLHKVPALVLHDGSILTESTLIVEYLDSIASDAKKVLSKADAYQRFAQKHAVQFYDSQVTPLKFKAVRLAATGKTEDAKKALLAMQERIALFARVTGLVERQKSSPSFFWGNQLTYTDICLIPVIEQDLITIKAVFGVPLRQVPNDRKDLISDLYAVQKYATAARKRTSYQKASVRIDKIPSFAESPLLAELNVKTPQEFNFENVYTYFIKRKFLGLPAAAPKPAL